MVEDNRGPVDCESAPFISFAQFAHFDWDWVRTRPRVPSTACACGVLAMEVRKGGEVGDRGASPTGYMLE